MAGHKSCDKPLTAMAMALLTDVNMRHSATMKLKNVSLISAYNVEFVFLKEQALCSQVFVNTLRFNTLLATLINH